MSRLSKLHAFLPGWSFVSSDITVKSKNVAMWSPSWKMVSIRNQHMACNLAHPTIKKRYRHPPVMCFLTHVSDRSGKCPCLPDSQCDLWERDCHIDWGSGGRDSFGDQ